MSDRTPNPGNSSAGSAPKRKRKRLAPSQKYEVYTSTLTSSATQRELADKYGINRSTIRQICTTAKTGALEALAAAQPGRRQASPEAVELGEARKRIEMLEKTVAERAMQIHLIEGKDEWD